MIQNKDKSKVKTTKDQRINITRYQPETEKGQSVVNFDF